MELVFGALAAVVIIIALFHIKRQFYTSKRKNAGEEGGHQSFANCPLCSSPLLSGQNLVSKVFGKAGKSDDQLCYVYGCSNCYPSERPGVSRRCPVCRKEVSSDGYLVSRMFNKTKSGKPHVIINGCGSCNRHGRKP